MSAGGTGDRGAGELPFLGGSRTPSRRGGGLFDPGGDGGASANPPGSRPSAAGDRPNREAPDLWAEAESAWRRLRANPNDKEAADALERALRRVKERTKGASGRQSPPEGSR
jgi:hypothetical protein